ncbi:replication protein RepA [Rothia nasimurium]|uniref:replication protein RepA n=1 Tax=Rothia nasimurium TaxID=85336 RepID=UPI003BA15BC4
MPSIAETTEVWNREIEPPAARFQTLVEHAGRSIELQEAGKIKAGSYLLADLTDLSFPYKKPDPNMRSWERSNGRKKIVIQPGMVPGPGGGIEYVYPYGIVPRLFLIWLTTEIKLSKSRRVEVGKSVNALRAQLGISSGGKQHANFTRQLEALFSAHIVVFEQGPKKEGVTANKGKVLQIADSWEIWKSSETGEVVESIPSTLEVSESFYNHVQNTAVPLVSEIVSAFKRDPMRLDIYCWLVHRLYMQRAPESNVSWSQLSKQFGGNYARERSFKKAFVDHLQVVLLYYPEARVSVTRNGLILRRSKLHIPPRGAVARILSVEEVVSAAAAIGKAS